jgi:hypothetical protein
MGFSSLLICIAICYRENQFPLYNDYLQHQVHVASPTFQAMRVLSLVVPVPYQEHQGLDKSNKGVCEWGGVEGGGGEGEGRRGRREEEGGRRREGGVRVRGGGKVGEGGM